MRRRPISASLVALLAAIVVVGAACSSDDGSGGTTPVGEPTETTANPQRTEPDGSASQADVQRFPDVIDAEATLSGGGWTFAVTISSPYDSPERYADGWRILGPDGTEYGFRLLTHDHATEQPFTRSLDGVEIPAGVTTVTIEGRDQQYGFGGSVFELTLDGN